MWTLPQLLVVFRLTAKEVRVGVGITRTVLLPSFDSCFHHLTDYGTAVVDGQP